MTDLLIGQEIGQYVVMSKIGQGGMASVYKAFQSSLARYVAIKVLPKELAKDASFVKRFQGEAKAVAALEHPHILPVYDSGSYHDQLYMVMRFVDGGTLDDLLAENNLSYTRIAQIIGDIASALDYAHSLGIVHRDVKPSNVLIDQHGVVLLTDFGLAKVVKDSDQSRITKVGTVVGTATYMAPEQAADEPLDARSDIYSLGVVLFEMLTGRPPFDAETMVAIALKHINEPTPSLQAIDPNIPAVLEQVVFKAMEKWPEDRYQTAAEFGNALQDALSQIDTAEQSAPRTATFGGADPKASTASARINRPRHRQSSQEVGAPPPAIAEQASPQASILRQPWIWGSFLVALVTTISVILFLGWWFRPAPLPENSLLFSIPAAERQAIISGLGTPVGRYPRSNYSRQYFEGGLMYWWENPAADLDPIYVIYNATNREQGNDWSQYKNTWTPDEPIVPDYCPEAGGPNGPIMGFGRLWCYNGAVKKDLVAATAPEEAKNDATIEVYHDGIVFSIPLDEKIWVLLNDGTWKTYPLQ